MTRRGNASTTRRTVLRRLAGAAIAAPLVWSRAHAQPSYTVSAAQLQQVLQERFPLRQKVGQLLTLDVPAPRIRLLPALDRVGAWLTVDLSGPLLGRNQTAAFDVDFALRYEATDRSIRAHQLRLLEVQLAGLAPEASDWLNRQAPAITRLALDEVVLHRLKPQDLALADTLGLQPDGIRVTDKGLVIGFVPKPL